MKIKNRFSFFLKWILNGAILFWIVILGIVLFSDEHGLNLRFWRINKDFYAPTVPVFFLLLSCVLRFVAGMKLRNALAVCLSIFLSFLMCEGVLRVIDHPTARIARLKEWRQPSDALGYELVPGMVNRQGLGSDFFVNSHGLRDHERPWEKPEGVTRILGIGDSFTFGMNTDLDQTFLKQLETRLNTGGKNVDVINGGVVAYNLYQALQYLKLRGIEYDPDLVIYFFFEDDIGGPSTPEELEKQSRDFRKKLEDQTLEKPLVNSFLLNFMRNSTVLLDKRFRFLTGADWTRNIEKRRKHFLNANQKYMMGTDNMVPFTAQLLELKRFTDEKEAGLLVVLIPDAVQLGDASLKVVNQLLKELCAENNIPFLDITPTFEAEAKWEGLYLFPLDAHTSPRGNTLIADKVFQKIKDQIPNAG